MSYVRAQLTSDDAAGGDPLSLLLEQQQAMRAQVDEVLERQKEEERNRKLALIVGGLGALFAAARLGVVAIPLIRRRRS